MSYNEIFEEKHVKLSFQTVTSQRFAAQIDVIVHSSRAKR